MIFLEQLELTLQHDHSVTVSLNNVDVKFKIDTGADVTVIPESVFKKLQGVQLQPCSRSLSGPCQNNIKVCR